MKVPLVVLSIYLSSLFYYAAMIIHTKELFAHSRLHYFYKLLKITESVVFSILGQQGVGPKLFGVFPGGRLEEYIKVNI